MKKKNNRFVWIDLEMTGLDPQKDVILEIATLITDKELNLIAQGPHFVIHQPSDVLASMDNVVRSMHTKSGLLALVAQSSTSLSHAAQATLEFIQEHCLKDDAPLCGNSIWKDKAFLQQYMPDIVNFLNYRIIDVSSIKLIVRRWYEKQPHTEFKKADGHRALDDIKESVRELAHYRHYFFIPPR